MVAWTVEGVSSAWIQPLELPPKKHFICWGLGRFLRLGLGSTLLSGGHVQVQDLFCHWLAPELELI